MYETFSNGNSLIHSLDPRYKVVFAAIYSFTVALSTQFSALIPALVFSILLICLARLNIREVAKRLAVVFGFMLLIWVVLPLTYEGDHLFHIGPLTITRPGVILSAQITLKSIAILLAFISLIATMTFATLGYSLNRLRIPEKIVHLLLLSYRYVFVIDEEYQRLLRAAKIRGFCPGSNMHTYKTFAYLIGMLFVRAAARAERVHQAMLCRGFKGKFYYLREFPPSRRNWIFSVLMGVMIIVLVVLEWV